MGDTQILEGTMLINDRGLPAPQHAFSRKHLRFSRSVHSDLGDTVWMVFRITNTTVGASLLAFPYSVFRVGWIAALAIVTFAFMYTLFSVLAVISAAHHTQAMTIKGCVSSILGTKFALFMDACVVLMFTGSLTAYVTIVGDYFSAVIDGFSRGVASFSPTYIKAILLIVIIPLNMIGNQKALGNISMVAVLLVLVTVLAIVAFSIRSIIQNRITFALPEEVPISPCNATRNETSEDPSHYVSFFDYLSVRNLSCAVSAATDKILYCTMPFQPYGVLAAPAQTTPWKAFLEIVRRISIFMPLFGCIPALPPLLHELKGSPGRRRRILRRSMVTALVIVLGLVLLIGLFSTLSFSVFTQTNVLNSFLSSELAMTVIKLLYGLNLMLSISALLFPLRAIIIDMARTTRNARRGKIIFYCCALAWPVGVVCLSILIPNIDVIFNASASLFGIAMYWLIPLLIIWKLPELIANSKVSSAADAADAAGAAGAESCADSNMATGIGVRPHGDSIKAARCRPANELLEPLHQEVSSRQESEAATGGELGSAEEVLRGHGVAGSRAHAQSLQEKEEFRQHMLRKMTKTRKVITFVAVAAICALNFTAFFLATFVNTITFKFLF